MSVCQVLLAQVIWRRSNARALLSVRLDPGTDGPPNGGGRDSIICDDSYKVMQYQVSQALLFPQVKPLDRAAARPTGQKIGSHAQRWHHAETTPTSWTTRRLWLCWSAR
jgi:hypothetical protein